MYKILRVAISCLCRGVGFAKYIIDITNMYCVVSDVVHASQAVGNIELGHPFILGSK